jgi:hypothetical protein
MRQPEENHPTRNLAPVRGLSRAWLAAFLGVGLIIGLIFWAMIKFSA